VAKKANRFFLDDESRKAVQGIADWDVPLTALGDRQSAAAGRLIRARFGVFDYVYHSGYKRTADTARGMLDAYTAEERATMKVRPHAFVRERDAGYTYDMTTAEAEAAFPWLQEYWDTHGPWFARPPGGESLADVGQRVYLFLNMLFRDRAGQRVLVATHGGTLRALRSLLERWPVEEIPSFLKDCKTPNCGVTVYRVNPAVGRLSLEHLNLIAEDEESESPV
jgi:broad specificity phosphatase PhoE